MAISITHGSVQKTNKSDAPFSHPDIKLEQIEVFGRLRMTKAQIADWYGLTQYQIAHAFRHRDVATAFAKGRSQTVVAIRQKQLELALKGNVQLLIHTGVQFGDQIKSGPAEATDEDYEPGRFSWDNEMKDRLAAARAAILSAKPGAA